MSYIFVGYSAFFVCCQINEIILLILHWDSGFACISSKQPGYTNNVSDVNVRNLSFKPFWFTLEDITLLSCYGYSLGYFALKFKKIFLSFGESIFLNAMFM